MCGTLSVERDGPHVKFSFEYASEEFGDAFSVERYHGMKKDEDKTSPSYGQMIEDWQHVHPGIRKFIRNGNHDWKMHDSEDANPIPHHECRFRARAYSVEVLPSGVHHQVTTDNFSNIVTA